MIPFKSIETRNLHSLLPNATVTKPAESGETLALNEGIISNVLVIK